MSPYEASLRGVRLRLRSVSPGLLSLPWLDPLGEWEVTEAPLRDIPVGPSRHLVRFVETDGALWALKEMPERAAIKEYDVLRALEDKSLPAVRAAGLVAQPHDDTAILVTRFLDRSWQYRRLFMRIAPDMPKHRERLFDAMAALLVDLHRNGVFWGDCSLANTLFSRDGQVLQAWLVDAETSEIHGQLSDGQRHHDLGILVENVAGGMIDLAARLDWPLDIHAELIDESASVATRYEDLWNILHAQPLFSFADRHGVEGQIRRLHNLGFAIDEVRLEPADGAGDDTLRLKVAVAARQYHATQLRDLAGLEVGQGQASILLGDMRSYQGYLQQQLGAEVPDQAAARRWAADVLEPAMSRAHAALKGVGDPIQAYCDLLEVRWLLSEEAGTQIGDDAALEALTNRSAPAGSAAKMAIADAPTIQFKIPTADALRAASVNVELPRTTTPDAPER